MRDRQAAIGRAVGWVSPRPSAPWRATVGLDEHSRMSWPPSKAPATGGTTLVLGLTALYRVPGVLVDSIWEPARTSPFIEEKVIHDKGAFDLVTEVDLVAAQLTATLRTSRHHDLLIYEQDS
jgi:hypothetical protein